MHVEMANAATIHASVGAGEIIIILVYGLLVFGSRRLGDLARGLGRGLLEFRKATKEFWDGIDQGAFDAGRSLGGIHGKPAAQAITPDNQTAELYEPAVFEKELLHNGRKNTAARIALSFCRNAVRRTVLLFFKFVSQLKAR